MTTDKDRRIAFILDHGLVKPKTVQEQAAEIFKTLGWRFIFWDTAYSMTFAVLTIAVVLAVLATVPDTFRFTATVAAAPLLYLLIAVFTETAERAGGLYELKQTCRYTTRQITALRTACYSAGGAVYTAVIAFAGATSLNEFAAMLPLGLLALFVCSVPQLALTRYARRFWANAVYAAVWIFINLALPLRFGASWERFLANVPIAVSLGMAAICLVILFLQITTMLTEVKAYALAK
jgi:hypothetical protein